MLIVTSMISPLISWMLRNCYIKMPALIIEIGLPSSRRFTNMFEDKIKVYCKLGRRGDTWS
jgi:hypothetical protein